MNIKENIINYIKHNRVSSTEVSDCLDKSGAISNILPINSGHFSVGNVFWTFAFSGSNWNIHDQIRGISKGDILIVSSYECNEKAMFGDLVSKYVLLYKQAASIVALGNLRDAPRLKKENWPIWCYGFNPVGCNNEKLEINSSLLNLIHNDHAYYNDSIAVCDDTGVVIIPKNHQNQDFLSRLEFIEEQEDLWYDCIDRKKWSTFDTVCLKLYKKDK
jgi:regulator of RNase E activity RraA